jgi:protein involved in polysaccharide export with SLBB domain
MRASTSQAVVRRTALLALALTPLLAGCVLTPDQASLFPTQNHLLSAARQARQACDSHVPRELDRHALPPYLVEPGDVLHIQPAEFDSPLRLPGDQTVLPDGTIQLGPLGTLVVAGKTLAEIEALVRQLARSATPLNVRLLSRASTVYYVLGEVHAPGVFPLTGRETVLDAILAAGGLSDRASPNDIILTRPTPPESCRIVLPVRFRDIVQLGDTSTNYQLAPGDRIFVASRSCWEGLFARCR